MEQMPYRKLSLVPLVLGSIAAIVNLLGITLGLYIELMFGIAPGTTLMSFISGSFEPLFFVIVPLIAWRMYAVKRYKLAFWLSLTLVLLYILSIIPFSRMR